MGRRHIEISSPAVFKHSNGKRGNEWWVDGDHTCVDVSTRKFPGSIMLIDTDAWSDLMPRIGRVGVASNEKGSSRYCRCYLRNRDLSILKRTVFVHKLLMGGKRTDHISGDPLDCRRANLRPANDTGNARNRHANKVKSSRYKGVSWNRQRQAWAANIRLSNIQRFLGYYDDEDECARRYDEAARVMFGKFGRVNFPNPGEQCAIRPERMKSNE